MLVNLSKDEIELVCHYLHIAVIEGYVHQGDDYEELDGIFQKFEGIIDACECQSQKQQEEIQ